MNLEPFATDEIPILCNHCARAVDLSLSCEMRRAPGRPVDVLLCHECLRDRPSVASVEAWRIAGALVDTLGVDGAKLAIRDALFLPAIGSRWTYASPRAPAVRLDFKFLHHSESGELLHFEGPFGPWVCRRDDWIANLAFQRVVPYLPPVRLVRQ